MPLYEIDTNHGQFYVECEDFDLLQTFPGISPWITCDSWITRDEWDGVSEIFEWDDARSAAWDILKAAQSDGLGYENHTDAQLLDVILHASLFELEALLDDLNSDELAVGRG